MINHKNFRQSRILNENEPMIAKSYYTSELFAFLRALKKNNDREWFQKNRERFETVARQPMMRFIEDFAPRLKKISPHFVADPRPNGGSMMRIHRDIRFSKDKSPFNTHIAASFRHVNGKETAAPGFYLHLQPEYCFVGTGLWHPDPATRTKVALAIVNDPAGWKRTISGKRFRQFCELSGDQMARVPRGFRADHPFADDLRRKDFITTTMFTQDEVCARDFLDRVAKSCEAAAPFVRFLARALGLPFGASDPSYVGDVLSVAKARLG